MIGVISMAPFPDIDLYLNVPHRGPTHSIWFASLVGFVYALILMYSDISQLSLLETFAIGFLSGFVGVIGHMIGDMGTPMGVAPLEPVSSFYVGLGWYASGDKNVNRIAFQVGTFAFVLSVVLGTVGINSLLDPIRTII